MEKYVKVDTIRQINYWLKKMTGIAGHQVNQLQSLGIADISVKIPKP